MGFRRKIDADTRAEKLVWETFNVPFNNLYLDPDDVKDYKTDIKIFKFLFSQDHEDFRMALWNSLEPIKCEDDVRKADLSKEEYEFLLQHEKARKSYHMPWAININVPFKTSRLILRPTAGDADTKLYEKHLKEDGDFTLFTNLKCTRYNIQRFGFDRPFFFVIEEKHSGNMVGYVGLRWEKSNGEKTQVMECEYYIFKPYRHKGYAKEALTGLCQRAFDDKLFELTETNYNYICRKKRAKPALIRAMIREDNTASCGLVEACGFTYTGTLHRHYWVEDSYCVNCCVYELAKEQL